MRFTRKLVFTLPVAAALVFSVWPATPAQNSLDAGEPAAKQLTKLYYGVNVCVKCHQLEKPVADDEALLYRGIEMDYWTKHDKHKDATEVLYNERAKQMAGMLKYDVSTDRRCLSCHGVFIEDEKLVHKPSFGALKERKSSGVSCVVCHGAFKEWVNAHAPVIAEDESDWKKLTRTDKVKYGLRDLWDPESRAALCCSCHVGSAAEGKVVTHEMYAAGHPPLPGIEVATFGDAMPRHWETLTEKVKKRPQHKAFHERIHFHGAGEMEQTRLLVISSLVAFRSSMSLVHAQATQETEAAVKEGNHWPEFASFDCYACHHDLKSDSWRQKRGTLGRPTLRSWSLALLPLAAGHADRLAKNADAKNQADLTLHLGALETSLKRTPYGNPKEVAERAKKLVDWSNDLLKTLGKARFDEADAKGLLKQLVDGTNDEFLEFDSARQVSWGLKVLLNETVGDHSKMKASLDALDAQMMLELPKGQQLIEKEFLPKTLLKISIYDPAEFQRTLRAIAERLKGN